MSKINRILKFVGINRYAFRRNIKGRNWVKQDLKKLKLQMSEQNEYNFALGKFYPIYSDKHDSGGSSKSVYFIQDLYVAQKIFKNNPIKHVDIGSRVDGFIAHVASYREIEMLDIRPLQNTIKNVKFREADLMQIVPELENYTDSISCLHALEHFGLGRYNDPIDINGHLKGFTNITKILKRNGTLYLSLPIGKQRIEFNAHRVFGIDYLLAMITTDYDIKNFSFIDDQANLIENQELDRGFIESVKKMSFSCGIFELIKK